MAEGNASESRLDQLFLAYRQACPDPDATPNFMPELWAKIEAREASTNWFGRVAKTLVTAALAATVILGMMISSANKPNAFLNATFVDAVRADQMSSLEPLHVDHLAELTQ
jgi:hypothetical protein